MPDRRFKPYQQSQMRLLPLDLSDLIPADDLVRVVDAVVESLDLALLRSFYPGGGAPAYDPRMMLKVVIYAYSTGVYSSRKISEATKANVRFMWLTGCTALDHMTVNRFRTERLRGCFEEVFSETVAMLADMGLVTLDAYFLDGTKVEANAGRYTFTWASTSICRRSPERKARMASDFSSWISSPLSTGAGVSLGSALGSAFTLGSAFSRGLGSGFFSALGC